MTKDSPRRRELSNDAIRIITAISVILSCGAIALVDGLFGESGTVINISAIVVVFLATFFGSYTLLKRLCR